MKTFIFTLLGLSAGAAGGFFAGSYFAKKKYLKMADDEIASVKKVYEKRFEKHENIDNLSKTSEKEHNKDETLEESTKTEAKGVNEIVDAQGYDTTSKDNPKEMEEVRVKKVKTNLDIKILTEDEYYESPLDSITLYYYADGVVADSDGNPIKRVNDVLGTSWKSHFGDNKKSPNSVYIRNSKVGIDYEVILTDEYFGDRLHPEDDD